MATLAISVTSRPSAATHIIFTLRRQREGLAAGSASQRCRQEV